MGAMNKLTWYSYVQGMPKVTQCLHLPAGSSGFSRAQRTLRARHASQPKDTRQLDPRDRVGITEAYFEIGAWRNQC